MKRGDNRRFAYKLALALGQPNVDRMLRSMTWRQFCEWMVYDELEPFGPEREDYRSAHVVQTLWNVHRDPVRNPNGYPIDDFLLRFGDARRGKEDQKQPLEYQEMVIDAWCFVANQIFKR